MESLFLRLLNMSITASWLTLAIIVLRLVLKKAPKTIICLMWAFVGIRLVFPFSVESVLSLIPSAETVPQEIVTIQTPYVNTGIPAINSTVNPIISQSFAPNPAESVNPMQIITFAASVIWLAGIAAMLIYTAVSYLRLRRKTNEAVEIEKGIWLCDRINTPFILGIVRPKIFLPSDMNNSDMEYVIAHEKAHLKRRDHFWKPLGFLLLTVYWFNPVMWVAYILLCRDIELACDEKVIKEMGTANKKPYSDALINCSVPRKMISACPLAFGEVGVKSRIRSVLNYKKPAFWIIILAVVISIIVAVCFLTDPKSNDEDPGGTSSVGDADNQTIPIPEISKETETSLSEIAYWDQSRLCVLVGFKSYYYEMFDSSSMDNVPQYPKKLTFQAMQNTQLIAEIKRDNEYWQIFSYEVYPNYDFLMAVSATGDYWLGRLDETVSDPSDLYNLKCAYPQYFGLNTANGLEIYVSMFSENNFWCTLMSGTDRPKTLGEIMALPYLDIEDMRRVIETYNIPDEDISVIFYQNPFSSYIPLNGEIPSVENTVKSKLGVKNAVFSTGGIDYTLKGNKGFVIFDESLFFGYGANTAIQFFYEDDEYRYYYPSMVSDHIIVKFDEGTEMTAEQALKENLISVEDLDKWNIDYYKTAKDNSRP